MAMEYHEALRLVRETLGRDDVLLSEFDDGWVGRYLGKAVVGGDPTDPPETAGSAAVVVNRHDGTVTTLADLGVQGVLAQYRKVTAVDDRFTMDVQRLLRDGGWHPDRYHYTAAADQEKNVLKIATLAQTVVPKMHTAAFNWLCEFGYLGLHPPGRVTLYCAPGRDARDAPDLAMWQRVADATGTTAYGIATWYDGRYQIVIAEDGRVVMVGPDRMWLVGSDPVTAISALATGLRGPVTVLLADGTVRQEPAGFTPTGPAESSPSTR